MQKDDQQVSEFVPDKEFFKCTLCADIFQKPVTLVCGHTFCHYCLAKVIKNKDNEEQNIFDKDFDNKSSQDKLPVPTCPTCSSIIWRTINSLHQNLVMSNLIAKYGFKPKSTKKSFLTHQNQIHPKYKILVSSLSHKCLPMPNCFTQIQFQTSFIDDILEQQSQSNTVVLTCRDFPEQVGISGKIFRPEPVQTFTRAQYDKYKALFIGENYVKILQSRDLQIQKNDHPHISVHLNNQTPSKKVISLCIAREMYSTNQQNLRKFDLFFRLYDKLNNPHYLRQIYQMVDQRVFLERNNPSSLIYGILRVLRLKDSQRHEIVGLFDDELRLKRINLFLQRHHNLLIEQIFNIKVPGNYSSISVVIVIVLMILLHIYRE